MTKVIFKILNLVALLLATAWMISKFDWEPFITFITLLASFIILIFKKEDTGENDADKKLFEQFKIDLPYYNISYIEHISLKSPYIYDNLTPFFNFDSGWKDSHHIFLNRKLEKKKQKLYQANNRFTSLVASNTFSTDNPRLYCIPREWESNNKKEYNEISKEINDAQDKVLETYNDFIKAAKKLLKV